jgi:hypothetical protein
MSLCRRARRFPPATGCFAFRQPGATLRSCSQEVDVLLMRLAGLKRETNVIIRRQLSSEARQCLSTLPL